MVYRKKIVHFFLKITTTKPFPDDGEGDVTIVLKSKAKACWSAATIMGFEFPVIVVTGNTWEVWT